MIKNPFELPNDVAKVLLPFIAETIEQADKTGSGRWGVTDYEPNVRLNVGWTEILTTGTSSIRLIVDDTLASFAGVPANADIWEGLHGKGYYPSIPNSVCIEVPYRPLRTFRMALVRMRPALWEAIRIAGRRGIGRGVQEDHSPDLVREIGRYVGKALPQPRNQRSSMLTTSDLMEGALRRVIGNRFERNAAARAKCIARHGSQCAVCDFSFEKQFGEIGRGFIHVHHITPVATRRTKYKVDPVLDLVPVCPNCHAMLHRDEPPLAIKDLSALQQKKTGTSVETKNGRARSSHKRS